MRKKSLGSVCHVLAAALMLCSLSVAASDLSVNGSIKRQLLTVVDWYPQDDDDALIGRYLSTITDFNFTGTSDEVAKWIIDTINNFGPDDTPRMLSTYVDFLNQPHARTPKSPPFRADAPGSVRYRILDAMERDLIKRHTPTADLALALFKGLDDPKLKKAADDHNYDALKSAPWLIPSQAKWIKLFSDNDDTLSHSDAPTDTQANVTSSSLQSVLTQFTDGPPWHHDKVSGEEFSGGKSLMSSSHPDDHEAKFISVALNRIASTIARPRPTDDQLSKVNSNCPKFGDGCAVHTVFHAGDTTGKSVASVLDNLLEKQQIHEAALAAYAIHQYVARERIPIPKVLPDTLLDYLGSIQFSPTEQRTKIVSKFSAILLKKMIEGDLNALSLCNSQQGYVSRREVNLTKKTYIEDVSLTCTDNKTLAITLGGDIPTDIVRMMEVNSSFLDIAGISLAARDLSSFARIRKPDDLDLIEVNPEQAIKAYLGWIYMPNLSSEYIRDSMMIQWPAHNEWFYPGWAPPMPGVFRHYYTELLPDFTVRQSQIIDLSNKKLALREFDRYDRGILDSMNAMPTFIRKCDAITYGLNFGHCPGPGSPTGKVQLVADWDARQTQEKQFAQALSFWSPHDLIGCDLPKGDSAGQLATNFNSEVSQYIAWFNIGSCDFYRTGKLELTDLQRQSLQAVFDQDPLFVSRYHPDFFGALAIPQQQQYTIIDAFQEKEVYTQLQANLNEKGMNHYLMVNFPVPFDADEGLPPPSISFSMPEYKSVRLVYPFNSEGGAFRDFAQNSNDYRYPVNFVYPSLVPLLNTRQGQDLAMDIGHLYGLWYSLKKRKIPVPETISAKFMRDEQAQEQARQDLADHDTDKKINETKQKITDASNGNSLPWTVAFGGGYGDTGASAGLSFNYGGIGLGIKSDNIAPVQVQPFLGPITLPAFGLLIAPSVKSVGTAPDNTFGDPIDNGGRSAAGASVNAQPITNDETEVPASVNTHLAISFSNIDWNSLLSDKNDVGRTLLKHQILAVAPSFTPEFKKKIDDSLAMPSFPGNLAHDIAGMTHASSVTPVESSDVEIAQAVCERENWLSCSVVVENKLSNIDLDISSVFELQKIWSAKYDETYDQLRDRHQLQTQEPDSKWIEDKIDDAVHTAVPGIILPSDMTDDGLKKKALDKVKELAAEYVKSKRYLAWLGPFVSNRVSWVGNLMHPSGTQTDYEELSDMNKQVSDHFSKVLEPYFRNNWKDILIHDLNATQPAWRAAGLQ